MLRATIAETKVQQREKVRRDVEQFLASGGKLTQCRPCAFARSAERLSHKEESRRQRAAKIASAQAAMNRREVA